MNKLRTVSRYFINAVLAAVIPNYKARISAKPFDIYREEITVKGKNENYWLADDGYLYYGSRWGIFFKSAQNDWWRRNSR